MKTIVGVLIAILMILSICAVVDRLIFLNYQTSDAEFEQSQDVLSAIKKATEHGYYPCEVISKTWGVAVRCGGQFWPLYEEYKLFDILKHDNDTALLLNDIHFVFEHLNIRTED
jgi:hypothetical protein